MIKNFKSIEELFHAIETDKKASSPSAQRYPLRLIFLNNFDSFKDIISYLSKHDATILQLKTLLPHDDGWFTLDNVLNSVKLLRKDTVVVPFSEMLRFFPAIEFNTIIISLFEIESSSINYFRRIYIPLVGLKERFEKDFLRTFHRRDNWAPIWNLEERLDKKIKIYQVAYNTGFEACAVPKDFKTINSTSDWLELWKQDNLDNIICKSKSMACLYEKFLPDAIFFLEKIDNQKDYLQKIVGLKVPIEYRKSETPFWDILINEIAESDDLSLLDFQRLVNYHFNIKNFNTISNIGLLRLWFQHKDKYSRWLLRNWIITQDKLKEKYIFRVMSGLNTYSDDELIDQVWLKIFDGMPAKRDIFNERKSYLKLIHKDFKLSFHQIEKKLQDKFNSIYDDSIENQSNYLTNISFAERKYIIESFKNCNKDDRSKHLEIIREIYPELFYYLKWDVTVNNEKLEKWITKYFQEYNQSKLLDQRSDKLLSILNEKSKDAQSFYDWYYKIENFQDIGDTCVIWIDGLGAEWLPLIEYLINKHGKEKNKYVAEKYIKKTNLPTITGCNRFDNAVHILELDKYVHDENPYKYPDDLIKQIELIEGVIKREIIERSDENIIIVSDHGFTFLAQKKFGNYKKFDFSESNHEGRCMWTERDYQDDSEFLLYQIDSGEYKDKKALIALKHTSLYNTPYREVHGGATPEEVLVPCIVISKIDERVAYNVKLLTKEISVRDPLVNIEIEPLPTIPPILIWKGKDIPLEKKNDKWCVKLTGFKAGKYELELNVHSQKFDVAITIEGGFKEKDLI
jgi:hypothetical protein